MTPIRRLTAMAAAVAAVTVSLGAALPTAAQAQGSMTLRLGYTLNSTSHYGVGATVFMNEVMKRTNNRIRINEFPANALGGEREMVEGAQLGTIDLVITSTGPVGNFVPETLITDIPFLFRDREHAHKVLDGPIGQEILSKCEAKGLICLTWGENGFRHVTNSKKEIKEPDDIKGLKLRTMENQVHMTAFRTLGAAPTPMAFPELYGALQQGVVDGQENPIPVILSARFATVQKHLSLTGHVYSPALFIMSKATWAKLSPADQQIMRDAAKLGAAANRQKVAADEAVGVDTLRKAGMTVNTNPDKAKFQAALAPAYVEYARRFGQANIDRIRNVK
jgi:tripartite ATP-independent transporter DctP family solute receptor